jgi:hypothetical protein
MLKLKNPKLIKETYQIERKTPTQLDLSLLTFSKAISECSRGATAPLSSLSPSPLKGKGIKGIG